MSRGSDVGYREWLAACRVVEGLLRQVCPHHDQATIEHNARAVLARLASHEPPLMVVFSDRVRWEDEERRRSDILARIAAACGHPDPAEACRVVLALVKEAQG